jgi:hypothetical protein
MSNHFIVTKKYHLMVCDPHTNRKLLGLLENGEIECDSIEDAREAGELMFTSLRHAQKGETQGGDDELSFPKLPPISTGKMRARFKEVPARKPPNYLEGEDA